jgi:hypothetical protein
MDSNYRHRGNLDGINGISERIFDRINKIYKIGRRADLDRRNMKDMRWSGKFLG